ncbi:hypothetical protein [Microscilla marina]|uniref:Uncharacterized protein n=1 Tax=Microscilla marina ATCC 23134 TaxID=313606 RepID=A1ZTT4_MICM2|nr:hypothetical protein [Microscilla marina]EAY26186.1 hypothetical protein M23134_02518 [Microscilla marina ATCC 23134]
MKLPFKNNLFYNLKSTLHHEEELEEPSNHYNDNEETLETPLNTLQEPAIEYGRYNPPDTQVVIQKIEINQANEINEDAPKKPKVVWGNTESPAKIKLKFTTVPAPQSLEELAFFRVDLMRSLSDKDFTFVNALAKFKDSGSARNYRNKTVVLPPDLEDGAYFLRIIALDEEEFPLNIEEEALQEELVHTQKISSDTDTFFFTQVQENICSIENLMFSDGSPNELPPANEVTSSLKHWLYAFIKLRLQNIIEATPVTGTTGFRLQTSRGECLESIYETILKPANKALKVQLPEKLAIIEQCMLANPEQVDPLLIDVKNYGPLREGAITLTEVAEGENDWIPASFRVKRAEVFAAIRTSATDNKGIWETFAIYNHIELIRDYVEEYEHWLNKVLRKLKKIEELEPEEQEDVYEMLQVVQNLELIQARTLLPNQKIGTVFLQSPLHPLRMIWSLNLWNWYQEWEEELLTLEEGHATWVEAMQEYLELMMPQNNPLLMSIEDKVYQYTGELAHGWGIYTPANQATKAATELNTQPHLLRYWQEVFNLAPIYNSSALNAEEIIGQIQSYLVRYPEKKELLINVLNADTGQSLAEAIYWLANQPETQDLQYTLLLFANDQALGKAGNAFELLAAETPELFEQVKVGVANIEEFFKTPEEFSSDLTFLVQPFSAQPILLASDFDKAAPTQLQEGLLQTPSLLTQVNGQIKVSRWVTSMAHFINEDASEDVLYLHKGFELWQQLAVTNLAGKVSGATPATQLVLTLPQKVLFDKASEASEWVIVKDTHITPDLFDFSPNKHQLPQLVAQDISSGIVVTKQIGSPLETIDFQLRDIGHNWSNSQERLEKMAEHLEVSGFPWFDMPQQATDMALTKMLLEKFDFLNDHFIIPVGKHPQWFPSEHQANLLLVAMDTNKHNIWVQMIGVASGDNLTEDEMKGIKQQIKRDIDNTYKALMYYFKPSLLFPHRATLIHELRCFLSFYIKRAIRYQSLDFVVAERYQQFLNELEAGYDVITGKLGIIYDHVGFGQIDKKQEENDWLFFEVGSRFVQALLQNI